MMWNSLSTRAKRWLKFSLISAAGVVFFALLYVWMTRAHLSKVPEEPVEPRTRVAGKGRKVAAARWRETPGVFLAVGTVKAKHRVEVASQLLARVTDVRVRPGDTVRKGQLLATLDTRELEARRAAALAASQAAEADLKLQNADLKREKQLLDSKVISQQSYDLAESRQKVSEARVAEARQHLAALEVTLSYCRVLAPIGGLVIERLAEPGDMALPGKTLLTMYDPASLRVEAVIPESVVRATPLGSKLRVAIEAVGMESECTVEEVVPQASPTARSLLIRMAVAKPEGLYPGMFARVHVTCGKARRLTVPAAAIRRVGQLEFVEEVTEGGTLKRRLVKTGGRIGEDVELLSGLHAWGSDAPPQVVLFPRKGANSKGEAGR